MYLTQLEEALNENTPAENLRKLVREIDERNFSSSGDGDICRAIAKNPNTPPDILKELFSEHHYPFEVLNNPILDLLLLENPNFINELFENHKYHYYDDTIEPFFCLDAWAASHKNKFIRIAVAKNPEALETVLEELVQDNDRDVRLAVVNNMRVTFDILKKFFEDEDKEVRYAAINKYKTISDRNMLLKDWF